MATHTPTPYTRLITTNHTCTPPVNSTDPAYPGPSVGCHPLTGLGEWQQILPNTHFSLVYSAVSRPELEADKDIQAHEARHDAGTLGLTFSGGSVCRVVEWAPETQKGEGEKHKFMHRTESLDYGIVLFGEIELTLPGQPPRILKPGDICVQRGTMHAWRNPSATQPARMVFVLIAADRVTGPDGQPVPHFVPPLPSDTARHTGLPEGVHGTEELLKARRI